MTACDGNSGSGSIAVAVNPAANRPGPYRYTNDSPSPNASHATGCSTLHTESRPLTTVAVQLSWPRVGRQCRALRARAPHPLRRERRPLRERLQLRPRDLWMRTPAKSTVSTGDHVLLADHLTEALNPLRYELRMLDHVSRVRHHAWNQDLPVRQFDRLPHLPFMLVSRVRGFDQVGASVYFQHD